MITSWNYPTSVRFGAGAIAELPEACRSLGMQNPLLVTDAMLAKLDIAAKTLQIVKDAGLSCAIFSDALNHASIFTWGWFNEGPSNQPAACPAYAACNGWARARDATRTRRAGCPCALLEYNATRRRLPGATHWRPVRPTARLWCVVVLWCAQWQHYFLCWRRQRRHLRCRDGQALWRSCSLL